MKFLGGFHLDRFFIFIILFLVYGSNLVGGMNSGDQVNYALTRAITEKQTVYLDEFRRYTYDTDYSISPKNRKIASDREPGLSLISVPFYIAAKQLHWFIRFPYAGINSSVNEESKIQSFTYLSEIFFVSLGLTITYTLLVNNLGIKRFVAGFTVLSIGFGSLLWKYAGDFSRQGLVAASFLVATTLFLALHRSPTRKQQIKYAACIGLALGFAALSDYFTLFTSSLIFLTLFLFHKKHIWLHFIFAFVPFLLIIFAYNYITFGRFLISPHQFQGYFIMYSDSFWNNFRTPLWWGIYLNLFSFSPIPEPAVSWALINPIISYQLGVRWATIWPYKGIFIQSPLLFFAVFGWWRFLKKQKLFLLTVSLLVMVLSVLVPMSMFTQFWSPNRYDTRHLLPIVPTLLLGILFFPPFLLRKMLIKFLFTIAALISILFGFESSISNFAPNISGEHRYSLSSLKHDIANVNIYRAWINSFPNSVNLPLMTITACLLYILIVHPARHIFQD